MDEEGVRREDFQGLERKESGSGCWVSEKK